MWAEAIKTLYLKILDFTTDNDRKFNLKFQVSQSLGFTTKQIKTLHLKFIDFMTNYDRKLDL